MMDPSHGFMKFPPLLLSRRWISRPTPRPSSLSTAHRGLCALSPLDSAGAAHCWISRDLATARFLLPDYATREAVSNSGQDACRHGAHMGLTGT
ncbi:hypothetical protein L209DRAFT_751840 [Thermothelomyces heterothallicus CBS 203.75]